MGASILVLLVSIAIIIKHGRNIGAPINNMPQFSPYLYRTIFGRLLYILTAGELITPDGPNSSKNGAVVRSHTKRHPSHPYNYPALTVLEKRAKNIPKQLVPHYYHCQNIKDLAWRGVMGYTTLLYAKRRKILVLLLRNPVQTQWWYYYLSNYQIIYYETRANYFIP